MIQRKFYNMIQNMTSCKCYNFFLNFFSFASTILLFIFQFWLLISNSTRWHFSACFRKKKLYRKRMNYFLDPIFLLVYSKNSFLFHDHLIIVPSLMWNLYNYASGTTCQRGKENLASGTYIWSIWIIRPCPPGTLEEDCFLVHLSTILVKAQVIRASV